MIRQATRQDIPILVDMMRAYAKEAPIKELQDEENHNADYVATLLFQLIVGKGFVFIDDNFNGFIAALKTKNVWCPHIMELRELAWWVKPEHRNGSLGGRLWKTFENKAQSMIDAGEVNYICATVMANSPMIDYTKRGFAPLEATFFRN